MYHPHRASPPPNQSSPILTFNLDDDDFDPLWGSASQHTKGPSEPVEDDSPVEEVAASSIPCSFEVRPMGRDRAKKKGSSFVARSESSVAGDPSLVDALLKRELKLEDQRRREQGELKRLKIAQRDKELELQQKMFEFQQQQKFKEDIKYYNEVHEHLTGRALSMALQQKDASGGGCGSIDLFAVGFVSLAAGSLEEGSFSEKVRLRLPDVVVSLLCAPMVVTIVLPTVSITSWGGVPAQSGIFGLALNELMDLSGESEVQKFMSFFSLQQIAKEKAFAKMLRDQADHVRSCLEKLHVMICDMQRVRSLVGNDSLECLRESQEMKNNKLKALTELIAQTEDAICRKEGHVDIMELSKYD
ncbi:hypothetical protein Tco_0797473 [Tanacetum coccineum]